MIIVEILVVVLIGMFLVCVGAPICDVFSIPSRYDKRFYAGVAVLSVIIYSLLQLTMDV